MSAPADAGFQTTVSLYDLIPLLNLVRTWPPNPQYERHFHDALAQARRADGWLAISESSAREARDHLGLDAGSVVNVSRRLRPDLQKGGGIAGGRGRPARAIWPRSAKRLVLGRVQMPRKNLTSDRGLCEPPPHSAPGTPARAGRKDASTFESKPPMRRLWPQDCAGETYEYGLHTGRRSRSAVQPLRTSSFCRRCTRGSGCRLWRRCCAGRPSSGPTPRACPRSSVAWMRCSTRSTSLP